MIALSHVAVLVMAVVAVVARAAAGAPGVDNRVEYTIVVTGSEMLAGAYPDAHTPFLTRTLHPLGFHCVGASIVDDTVEEIQRAVCAARQRTRLVIVTGGLGPTRDDVTRDALAALTGNPLREHPDLLADLERRFKTPREQLRANLRRQTEMPTRGGYLKNPNGSAAGLVFDEGDDLIVALPGPPRELQPMVRESLVPVLIERFGARDPGTVLMIRFVGIGESLIAQTMDQHVSIPEGVMVASLFEGSRVDFYFTLPGGSDEERAQLDALRAKVIEHLGEYVYATDGTTLERAVADRLLAARKRVAIAEIGSGGSLAAALAGTEIASQVLAGAYVAPDCDRLRRMLGKKSEQAGDLDLTATTRGLAERTEADVAVVVGMIEDDGQGGRRVEAVVVEGDNLRRQRIALRGTGDSARLHLTTQLLDLLRRGLL